MISKETLIAFPPLRKASTLYYHYRRNRWRWSPTFHEGPEVALDRPIYLLGTQGGGLTLLSRILHRHPEVISVTGNSSYWAGEDETQNALECILPEDTGWRRISLDSYPSRPGADHSWVYANNDFLPFYRRTPADATPAVAACYRSILRGIIRLNAAPGDGRVRFVDKSQSMTVRVGFLHAMLADTDPRFVLVARNPYAIIWNSATSGGVVATLDRPIQDRVRICAEHWRNSFEAALADADADPRIKLGFWKFEDILAAPEQTVGEICDFAGLPRDRSILPGPRDTIPWGSMYDAFSRRKWYPLRTDVNDRYLADLPDDARRCIDEVCGDLIDRLGYRGAHLVPSAKGGRANKSAPAQRAGCET